ncbi:hypothetical protein PIB30_030577 [Stylosanthes scabra]|uniref:Uncharacterized protein n=1 Tax=Stylosanthes scabra TaxID=79078 RepID=A0ABU6TCC2_9FABA|nr:hypothetical protein [Stylosanthes scabra]
MAIFGNTFDEVHSSKFDMELFIVHLCNAPTKCNPNESQTIEMVVEGCKDEEQAKDNSMPLDTCFLPQNHGLACGESQFPH